jgi:steroid 5-alpha reductase family enzyme
MFYSISLGVWSGPAYEARNAHGPNQVLMGTGFCAAVSGLVLTCAAELQRFAFKRRAENHAKLLRGGLWRYAVHVNYLGELICYAGFALMSLKFGNFWVPGAALAEFLLGNIRDVFWIRFAWTLEFPLG